MSQYFPPIRASVLNSDGFLNGNPNVSPERMENVVAYSLSIGEVLPIHENYPKIKLSAQAGLDRLWTPDADVAAELQNIEEELLPGKIRDCNRCFLGEKFLNVAGITFGTIADKYFICMDIRTIFLKVLFCDDVP